MKIEIEVPTGLALDVMETACYSSISYWATYRTYRSNGSIVRIFDIKDREGETEIPKSSIEAKDIMGAIKKIVEGDIQIAEHIKTTIATFDPCNIDAEAADCIVQVAVFNEVIFG